jgi:hypothetical protein
MVLVVIMGRVATAADLTVAATQTKVVQVEGR